MVAHTFIIDVVNTLWVKCLPASIESSILSAMLIMRSHAPHIHSQLQFAPMKLLPPWKQYIFRTRFAVHLSIYANKRTRLRFTDCRITTEADIKTAVTGVSKNTHSCGMSFFHDCILTNFIISRCTTSRTNTIVTNTIVTNTIAFQLASALFNWHWTKSSTVTQRMLCFMNYAAIKRCSVGRRYVQLFTHVFIGRQLWV